MSLYNPEELASLSSETLLKLKNNPEDSSLHIEIGRLFNKKNAPASAKKAFEEALRINPGDSDAFAEMGRILENEGNLFGALYYYNSSLNNTPEITILADAARIYLSLGDPENAKRLLTEALRLNPDDGKILALLGDYHISKKDFERASAMYTEALHRNYSTPEIYFRQGILARADGDTKKAEELLKKFKAHPKSSLNPFIRNRSLNELEIAGNKTSLESLPEILYVTLTNRCNANCTICCVEQTPPWEIRPEVIEEIKGFFPYIKRVFWLGGEVFLYKNFQDIFKQALKYPGMKQVIITNGLLFNEKWAELFSSSNLHLVYSIDSLNPELYEKIRVGSSYKRLMENISLIEKNKKKDSDFSTGMTYILMKSNYKELPHIPDFAAQHNFSTLTINEVRGEKEEKIYFSKDKEIADFVRENLPGVLRRASELGIELNNEMAIGAETPEEEILPNEEQDNLIEQDPPTPHASGPYCLYPWKSLIIDVHGKSIPWFYCVKEIGNTDRESLKDIWNGDMMQKYRENILNNNNCGICPENCIARNGENIFSSLI